jgi:hypothetical protein
VNLNSEERLIVEQGEPEKLQRQKCENVDDTYAGLLSKKALTHLISFSLSKTLWRARAGRHSTFFQHVHEHFNE